MAHADPTQNIQLDKIHSEHSLQSPFMEQAIQTSVAITNATESIQGEGVARPAGAPVRANSVDTPIFTEVGVF